MQAPKPPPLDPPRRPRKGVAEVAQIDDFACIIDVRSPAEFADDHIPGAISCPVLDDAERARIGTLYKQVSPFAAKKLGAAWIARNIARHVEERFLEQDKGWKPLIVCWRGGMRSGAMTTVLRSVGWDACQLEHGYKGFRHRVIEELETLPGRYAFRVLCGPTGSAKTRLLQAVAAQGGQIVDLEALACHRGSVLGQLPDAPQPGQKWFETQLWDALRRLDPARPVFIEAESRKIGRLRLPDALHQALRQAPRHEIVAGLSARVDFLLRDYGHFVEQGELLKRRLEPLLPLLGHATLKAWRELIDAGDFAAFTEAVLREHYDPHYARSQQRDFFGPNSPLTVQGALDETTIAGLAGQLLAVDGIPSE